ncbi:MAG: hypothetical protein WC445_01870 [Patescibacteria group bacterium]
MKKIIFIVFLLILVLPTVGSAANSIELYFFEGQGCQHCAKMKSFLEGLKTDYPNLVVKDFEVYFNRENQDLFEKMATAYKISSNGVPAIFIGNEAIIGENYEKLKSAMERCSLEPCLSPADKLAAAENNVNSALNANQPRNNNNQNEIVGWIVIVVIVTFGIIFTFFIIKIKNNV